MTRLDSSFFNDRTELVAQKLLGMLLVRSSEGRQLVGKIVETESYTFDDPASHCYQRKTVNNRAMFGPVGHAYIYLIYGIHYGLNVVAYNEQDTAGGVLIRAVEPLCGIETMHVYRPVHVHALTNGPGKLTQAFNIDKQLYGYDLVHGQELFLARPPIAESMIIKATPRIGISKAQEYNGRFIIENNRWVTPHRFNKLLYEI